MNVSGFYSSAVDPLFFRCLKIFTHQSEHRFPHQHLDISGKILYIPSLYDRYDLHCDLARVAGWEII